MIIKNKNNGKVLALKAWECRTLRERCRGLMFRKISSDEACVLVSDYESLLNSSIHMMFVPQPLHVIWLNDDREVVSVKKLPKANLLTWWRTYAPSKPAKYVIELLDKKGTLVGDKLQFIK